jgi:hypothetical protein
MKVSRFGSRVGCAFRQGPTGGGDVLPVLFGRADALFLNGSLRWRRKRKIADWLTFTFSFAKASLKLRQRAIRLFCYELLDQMCKRKCLVAAKFSRANTACFALTLDEPANGA